VGNCTTGIAIVDGNDNTTWRIDFIDSATDEQRTSAHNVMMALDYGAYVQGVTNRADAFKVDPARIEFLDYLRNKTCNEIEAFVRTRLNADGVTNLASAILFCKRVETAFVQVAKALAKNIGDNGN
jgi:hypothetical protein